MAGSWLFGVRLNEVAFGVFASFVIAFFDVTRTGDDHELAGLGFSSTGASSTVTVDSDDPDDSDDSDEVSL